MKLTVDQINLTWLESANVNSLKDAMRAGGDVLAAVNDLLKTPEGKKIAYEMLNDPDYVPKALRQPTPEEAELIAEDEARASAQAAEAEAQRLANTATELAAAASQPVVDAEALATRNANEDTEARKIGATLVRNTNGEIEKIVVDYQVRNDEGRPVGRATHFEAHTWVDILGKVINAHANAVTYGERIKTNRFKQSQAAFESTERSTAATAARAESERLAAEAVNEKDPVKMQEAVKKAATAEREAQSADQAAKAHGKIIAETWMSDHTNDFLVCQASINLIGGYLKENKLDMSYENLDKAFQAVKHQLPPVPTEGQQESATAVPTSAATSTNPPPAAATESASAKASITQADLDEAVKKALQSHLNAAPPAVSATAQETTPATANQPSVARRPGVNGSLQPGSLSAARPSASSTQQTPAETRSTLLRAIAKMGQAEFRRKLKDAKYVAQLEAAGVPYK